MDFSLKMQILHLDVKKKNYIYRAIGSLHSIDGFKDKCKEYIEKINIPLIPGYFGKNQDIEFIKEKANKIGYPLLLKASHGGGGKGCALCRKKIAIQKSIL